jgi:PP-loop superfamily ATP-utilizing enzyme
MAGESEENVRKYKKLRDKLEADWNEHREKIYREKLEEIEEAHNYLMADNVEETLDRLENEAAHNENAGLSMRMNLNDYK